jgi:hypothetical protein
MALYHPEANEGEKFVGNTQGETVPPHVAHLRARLGDVAFDIHGSPLPKLYRPLIIDRRDLAAYDRIMTQRFEAGSRRRSSRGHS